MKLKIPIQVADFLRDNATIIEISGNTYCYLPYWYKIPTTGNIVEEYLGEKIPDELREVLEHNRK